ncbi:hypothetical protein P5P86_19540 [Nocardioides sp. BP30]|uniref:hypothetical protein n=1 Tax=Nocardioides sp. BP30 TaxID=3036374 RepID=UPI002469101F|nr:hypothetical protein [Nocardioides sp. BP30]WGL52132.1 hypothetical protein P5P86_19540 [Nocardioides sp. BP30]
MLEAYEAIVAAFPDYPASAHPDGQGGLWVELTGVPLDETYTQADSFVAFLLPFNLPGADIYPMFMRPDLARRDGAPLGQGFASTNLQRTPSDPPRAVMQISRRTRGGTFLLQTAPQKIMKVLDWVMTR